MALAVDMPDAPVTQDTVTAGGDGTEDNEDDEGNDQPDDLPDPEDAPVTTETITSGDDDGSKEDKDDEENGDEGDGTNVLNDNNVAVPPVQTCPNNQERALFAETCMPVQSCPSDILSGFVIQEVEPEPSNNCANTGSEAELEDENSR